MNPAAIYQNKQYIQRIREIVKISTKHGFNHIIEHIKLKDKLPFAKRYLHYKPCEEPDATTPERARLVLEELGSTFIKFGQILSTREDLIGEEYAKEFSKLQDKTPPISYDIVKSTIEHELGHRINYYFSEFDKQPLASASIGQVHKATLKDGSKVAIKIQKPDILKQTEKDIRIMRYLANLIEKHMTGWKYYNIPQIIDEFERSIRKELDYQQEKTNIKKFRKMFKDDETIFAPKVYDKYSTKRILTMEYINGTKIKDLKKSRKRFDKKLIAKRGAESFFKQVLIHGFFHADPHPGNIFILKDNVICFIDFGMMGHIDKDFMNDLAQLFIHITNYNINGLINQLTNMGLVNETIDIRTFKYDTIDIMDMYYDNDLKNIQLGEILNKLMKLLVKHKVTLPREIVLLSRAIIIIESIGTTLDPGFNIAEEYKPYAKQVIRRKISPLNLANSIKDNAFEYEHLLKTLPKSMKEIINRMARGKINIEFEHKNLDAFSNNLKWIGNRLSFAMIISSLIIGSSLIMQTDKGHLLFGFPIIGILGFVISAILGLGLIISIIRFKKI